MRTRHPLRVLPLAILVLAPLAASAAVSGRVLQVGPSRTYHQPSQAAAASLDGDTIEIDAGLYSGDVCAWYRNDLVIRGVGGFAHLDAAGQSSQGKAIWVTVGANATVENIEFSGATVVDANGAGIRAEGSGLTIRGCFFHDNQEGILTNDMPAGDILIESSEFARNGAGDGYSHNLYIGHVRTFTFRSCYSHHAISGHDLKSRALVNWITNNRIMDEATGTASYTIDLPNGGESYLIGNLIQQGPQTDNNGIIAYAEEGAVNPVQQLYVVGNTIVNDAGGGTFLWIRAGTTASITDNLIVGPGTVLSGPGTMAGNVITGSPGFVSRATFDYHLVAGSPAIDAGVDPGSANGHALMPMWEYVHPLARVARTAVGAIDVGAYEYAGGGTTTGGTTTGGTTTGGTTTGGTTGGTTTTGGSTSHGGGGGCGAGGGLVAAAAAALTLRGRRR